MAKGTRFGHSGLLGSQIASFKNLPLTAPGDRLTPTHTMRRGQRLRYYVSHRLLRGGPDPKAWRLPAPKLEALVRHLVADHIAASARSQVLLVRPDLRHTSDLQARAQELVKTLRDDDPAVLRSILVGGTITDGSLSLALDGAVLSGRLAIAPGELAPGILSLTMPFTLRRRGVEMKLLAGKPSPAPDPALRTALADAHRWAQALQGGTPLHDIARAAGHHEAHIRTRTPLAFLSPRIQRAILEGTQPADLTLERLVRHNLPLDWESQERLCRI